MVYSVTNETYSDCELLKKVKNEFEAAYRN